MTVLIDDINIEQHISIQLGPAVKDLASDFLQSHRLSHFSYVRQYHDNSGLCLTTHPEITVDFYQYKFYNSLDFQFDFAHQDRAYFLWMCANENERKLFDHAKNYYNIANGIIVINNQDLYQEQFYFATDIKNQSANNFYVNNMNLLEQFGHYFKDKAHSMIKLCHTQRILVTDRVKNGDPDPYRTRPIPPNNHTQNQKTLSKREAQLLNYLAKGYSCQKIANILDLKVKTIYLYQDNLKKKLGVYNRDQLVAYYWQKSHMFDK